MIQKQSCTYAHTHTHSDSICHVWPHQSKTLYNILKYTLESGWEGKLRWRKCVYMLVCASMCVYCIPTAHPLNELHAILKDTKLVCEWGCTWSTIGDWPTRGTMGNKRGGDAKADKWILFPMLNLSITLRQYGNSLLGYVPPTGDTETSSGGHIEQITMVTISYWRQTLVVFYSKWDWWASCNTVLKHNISKASVIICSDYPSFYCITLKIISWINILVHWSQC